MNLEIRYATPTLIGRCQPDPSTILVAIRLHGSYVNVGRGFSVVLTDDEEHIMHGHVHYSTSLLDHNGYAKCREIADRLNVVFRRGLGSTITACVFQCTPGLGCIEVLPTDEVATPEVVSV